MTTRSRILINPASTRLTSRERSALNWFPGNLTMMYRLTETHGASWVARRVMANITSVGWRWCSLVSSPRSSRPRRRGGGLSLGGESTSSCWRIPASRRLQILESTRQPPDHELITSPRMPYTIIANRTDVSKSIRRCRPSYRARSG
jgi:hypothetical protein